MDAADVSYVEARAELLEALLRADAFGLPERERRALVATVLLEVASLYPELDAQLLRQLFATGMRATRTDAVFMDVAHRMRPDESPRA